MPIQKRVAFQLFTLIELLVVIAIIAILASMLLPALGAAKSQARKIECGGKLSQIGKAVGMYIGDFDGWFPTNSPSQNEAPGGWKLSISEYLEVKTAAASKPIRFAEGVFACPLWDFANFPDITEKYGYYGGYCWNYYYMGFNDKDATRKRVRINQVPHPSETILVGDSVDWYDDLGNLRVLYRASYTIDSLPGAGNRHQKGINLLWADLSARWMSQRDLRAGKESDVDYYYKKDK